MCIRDRVKDSAKLLVRFGVGFDKVDLKAASKNGIAIARTTGANTTACLLYTSVLSFLELRPERFYVMEPGEKGFVTGRAWEDLSEILLTMEELELGVEEALFGQYLQEMCIRDSRKRTAERRDLRYGVS